MKLLGIDWGIKKIGLAIADTQTGLADPLLVTSQALFFNQVTKICRQENIAKILVGLPTGPHQKAVMAFAHQLGEITGLAVVLVDETLTTKEAKIALGRAGASRVKSSTLEDAYAAALMLQYFLEGGHNV